MKFYDSYQQPGSLHNRRQDKPIHPQFFLLHGLLLFCVMILPFLAGAALKPERLLCEYLNNPMAIDIARPRLSWVNIPGRHDHGQIQTAYEIRVAGSREDLTAGKNLGWASGKSFPGTP